MITQRRAVSLIEVLVVAAASTLVAALLIPALQTHSLDSKRVKCTTNLRRLAQAHYIYAQDDPQTFVATGGVRKENDGAMRIFDPKDRRERPGPGDVPSPTVDLWWLLRQSEDLIHDSPIKHWFICPTTKDTPDPADDVSDYYDFAGPKHLSYAYQYQHDPDRDVLGTMSEPNFPLMADSNPYIKGKIKSDILEDRNSKFRGNSTNHSRRKRNGQNVLYQDGHVSFEDSPDVGLSGKVHAKLKNANGRDNIYTTHTADADGFVDPGAAAPTKDRANLGSRSDACLVP